MKAEQSIRLWTLDGETTQPGAVWSAHPRAVVEFGGFTRPCRGMAVP